MKATRCFRFIGVIRRQCTCSGFRCPGFVFTVNQALPSPLSPYSAHRPRQGPGCVSCAFSTLSTTLPGRFLGGLPVSGAALPWPTRGHSIGCETLFSGLDIFDDDQAIRHPLWAGSCVCRTFQVLRLWTSSQASAGRTRRSRFHDRQSVLSWPMAESGTCSFMGTATSRLVITGISASVEAVQTAHAVISNLPIIFINNETTLVV